MSNDPWAECRHLATQHYENFTVGSFLLPKSLRYPIWSVYAYCRTVDDLGDEAGGDRLALLDAWEEELTACYEGTPRHPVMRALQETIDRFDLPREPFWRLIEANRRDQRVTQYETFADLADYCAYSANPVGRIVLRLFGCSNPETEALSDAVCTALQLTNFWQDVAVDFARGRVYLPLEDVLSFGYSLEALGRGEANTAFRRLMAFEVERARGLFDRGDALIPLLPPRFQREVALFSAGGRAILRKIEAGGYDVLKARPTLSRWEKAGFILRALLPWRPRRASPL